MTRFVIVWYFSMKSTKFGQKKKIMLNFRLTRISFNLCKPSTWKFDLQSAWSITVLAVDIWSMVISNDQLNDSSFSFKGFCRCTPCHSKAVSSKLWLWSPRDDCQASGTCNIISNLHSTMYVQRCTWVVLNWKNKSSSAIIVIFRINSFIHQVNFPPFGWYAQKCT